MFAEGYNLPIASSCPLIDNLIVISDREDVLKGITREKAHKSVLSWRSVLKLVNEPVGIRLANAPCNARDLMGQPARI